MASGTQPGGTVVVGGGMLGAALALSLAATDREVTLLESAPTLGGLTSSWSLDTPSGPVRWDRFYHVVLNQDRRVLALLDDLGLADRMHLRTVRSELLAGGRVHPMSSVADLLTLPVLDPLSRVRVGAAVGLGALWPARWSRRATAAGWLRRVSGRRATEQLWLPLLRAKLGEQAEQAGARFILSTFRRLLQARLRGGDGDRFGYVEGGYATVLAALGERLVEAGVTIRTRARADRIEPDGDRWRVYLGEQSLTADEVVLTVPGPVAAALTPDLPPAYRSQLDRVPYLGCVCVSLVLARPLTGGYLTYVTDDTPYTAVVEMTNLIDAAAETGGHALVYLPRYCAPDDPAFDAAEDAVIERCIADLLTRYPTLRRDDVLAARLARARHVMPVPTPGRGDDAPPVRTGLPGLYLASSAQVVDGTLNVETTLALAQAAVRQIMGGRMDAGSTGPQASRDVAAAPAGRARAAASTASGRAGRPVASISLDADNLWSYLKTHGDPAWEARPGYLPTLGPRLIDTWGRHGITATVFVVGHDAATPDGAQFVASLVGAGHEIANHSFEHEPWLHLYSRDRLDDELARTEEAIVAAGAPRPTGFRGPGYSLSPTLLDLLEQRGYRYDATTLPTWIGPLARAYYFRSAKLSAAERARRRALFGSAAEGLRPVGPYRWRTATGQGLVELPVTTMPLARIPIHVSYLLHAHQVNPRLARAYLETALRTCRLAGVGPSILLHPLDLLDAADAPGLEFFPGMALPAAEKRRLLDHVLSRLTRDFEVVGTGEHARRLAGRPLPVHDAGTAGPRGRHADTPATPVEVG
jgi:protoporphyrinogen oxidase/peptidoglycan/xylan/chitin deacetylase (PgdA/CDA1 family)